MGAPDAVQYELIHNAFKWCTPSVVNNTCSLKCPVFSTIEEAFRKASGFYKDQQFTIIAG